MSEWCYVGGGQKNGPVSLEHVQGLLLSGQLQSTDLVWQQGTRRWVKPIIEECTEGNVVFRVGKRFASAEVYVGSINLNTRATRAAACSAKPAASASRDA